MKTLKKLKLNDVHGLTNNEMKKIEGGVDLNEYCCTLHCICFVWGNTCDQGGFHYGQDICISGGWWHGGVNNCYC